jgi:hypothetical protein
MKTCKEACALSQPGDSVTFQVIEGKIEFHSNNKTIVLNNGNRLTLTDSIKFTLTALEKSVFFLTLLTAQKKQFCYV